MPQSGQDGPPRFRVCCEEIWSSFQMSAWDFFIAGAWGRSTLPAQTSHKCCSWISFRADVLLPPFFSPSCSPGTSTISVTWTDAGFLLQTWQSMEGWLGALRGYHL